MRLVLASGSPRRRELLGRLGIPFDIKVAKGPERPPEEGEDPVAYASSLAVEKAREVAARCPEDIVLAGDTVVFGDGEILNKPETQEEAFSMLAALRGKEHLVVTAVVVECGGGEFVDAETTVVAMGAASDEALCAYARSGEPLDKAGAYAIQGGGGQFITGIDGCLENVIGLPLCVVARLLERCGLQVSDGASTCHHYRLADGWPPPPAPDVHV